MALEPSPEVLNNLLSRIGAPEKYQIHDVLGTEEEDLQEVPGQLRSILLLLPKDEMYREKLQEKNSDVGQPNMFFIQQEAGNVCGTIVLLHSIVTGNKQLLLADSPLKTFLDSAQSLSPSERGDLLLESEDLMAAHTEAAAEGETSQVEEAAHHLISFVRVGDQIYDMDNLASKPLWVAECEDTTFPAEAMKAAKSYIDRNPSGLQFNILALMEEE